VPDQSLCKTQEKAFVTTVANANVIKNTQDVSQALCNRAYTQGAFSIWIASAVAFCSMSSPDPSNTLRRGKAPVTDTAILKIESLNVMTQSQHAVTRRCIFNGVCKTLTPIPQHSIKQQSLVYLDHRQALMTVHAAVCKFVCFAPGTTASQLD